MLNLELGGSGYAGSAMMDLPLEVECQIHSYLEFEDLLGLLSVSKRQRGSAAASLLWTYNYVASSKYADVIGTHYAQIIADALMRVGRVHDGSFTSATSTYTLLRTSAIARWVNRNPEEVARVIVEYVTVQIVTREWIQSSVSELDDFLCMCLRTEHFTKRFPSNLWHELERMLRNSAQGVTQEDDSGYQRFQLGKISNSVAVRCLTHLSTVINRACQPRGMLTSTPPTFMHNHDQASDREREIALFYRERLTVADLVEERLRWLRGTYVVQKLEDLDNVSPQDIRQCSSEIKMMRNCCLQKAHAT